MADMKRPDDKGLGWFGNLSEVLHFLRTVGADKDSEGQFIISGAQVATGLSGDEVVVPAETTYLVEGRQIPLAANMPASYGIRARVIS